MREVHEELSFDIFDKCSNYLWCPYQYWTNALLIWHLILSSWSLVGQCVGFAAFLKCAGYHYFAAFEDKIIDYGKFISKIVIAL